MDTAVFVVVVVSRSAFWLWSKRHSYILVGNSRFLLCLLVSWKFVLFLLVEKNKEKTVEKSFETS